MSVSAFALFTAVSTVVLALIVIFREPLIDIEDYIWAQVKALFKSIKKGKEQRA